MNKQLFRAQMAELRELFVVNNYVPEAGKAHHGVDRFRLPDKSIRLPKLLDFLKWMVQRAQRKERNVHRPQDIPWQEVNMANLQANNPQRFSVTWLGHVSMLLQMGGLNILLDPTLSARASPFLFAGPKRYTKAPCQVKQLPRIDAVLISHNHYDHLDRLTIMELEQWHQPTYYVPLGLKPWFARAGVPVARVVELDWWQQAEHAGVAICFTPAQHWSKRGIAGTNCSLWGGFYVHSGDNRFYFPGDSGYSPWMDSILLQIKTKLGAPTVAALPIGAYLPRWFMQPQHANPADAVAMCQTLQPQHAFGVHWGVFVLTEEAIQQPMADLQSALQAANLSNSIEIWAIGHTQFYAG